MTRSREVAQSRVEPYWDLGALQNLSFEKESDNEIKSNMVIL
jgi:hypothetical protein